MKLGTKLLLNVLPVAAWSLLSRSLALEHPTACGTKETALSYPQTLLMDRVSSPAGLLG